MPAPTDQVRATRALLTKVCKLLEPHLDDVVLVGGWVPDVRFPSAHPAHIGSIDVDMALRLRRDAYEQVVALLRANGFRVGTQPYQFLKDVSIGGGRTLPARLDLLTSTRHRAEALEGTHNPPHPIRGAEIAFIDNSLEAIADEEIPVRVVGIAAFLVMKSIALTEREKPKDAYDIHFCLENHPDAPAALVRQFDSILTEDPVQDALKGLARKFHNAEDEGPRMVADVEELMGDARAIRKLAAFTRVSDLLRVLRIIA